VSNDDMKLKWDFYVRRLQNTGWDDVLEKSMKSIEAVGKAVMTPNPFTIAEALLSVARTMTADDLFFYDVLDRNGWRRVFPSCVKDQLLEILEPQVTSRIKVNRSGNTTVMLISKPGVRIGWVKENDENTTTDILAHVDCYADSVKYVRDLLWSTVDPSRIVLSAADKNYDAMRSKPARGSGSGGQVRVVTDDLVNSVSSSAADEWVSYLERCNKLDIKRTLLFYGRPGCGKSTLARTICEKLAIRSLRVRVEDIGSMGTESVGEIISIFEPDAVIFDDLDRSMSQLALFEMMEMLHKRTKFVFATVNHLRNLADALKRPGRFDEVVHISALDENAVRQMLGSGIDDEVFETLKSWPVAFIKEYLIRCKIVGKDKALDSLKELQQRVKELGGDENADDASDVSDSGDNPTDFLDDFT
jgi:adenylate kinase family enzyme